MNDDEKKQLEQYILEHQQEAKEILEAIEILSKNKAKQDLIKAVIEKLKERGSVIDSIGAELLEGFIETANQMNNTGNEIKQTRSFHAKEHKSPIDRITKITYGLDENYSFNELLSTNPAPIRTDKKGRLSVSARLVFDDLPNVILPQSLSDPFVRAVCDSALSLYIAGNADFSDNQIYCEMSGNTRRSSHPNREILNEINRAVEILSRGRFTIDATNEAGAKGYRLKKVEFTDYLLPVKHLHIVHDDGRIEDKYEFKGEPVLFTYANQKNQIVSVPIDMLELPEKMKLTRETIIIQRCLIERVKLMSNEKNNLGYVIKYDSIYKLLGKQVSSRTEKKRVRDTVKRILDNWRGIYIVGYKENFEKGAAYSIRIDVDFDKPKELNSGI